MRTIIHSYYFNLNNKSEEQDYSALVARLKKTHKKFRAIGEYYYPELNGAEIELEIQHIFDNQWNTAPIGKHTKGLRVFDWAESAIFNDGRENRTVKKGHYLDLTPEMIAIRKETLQCGYCGRYYPHTIEQKFCTHCLDSPYLEAKNLKLLRLSPVEGKWSRTSPELTAEEYATLFPLYHNAQVRGKVARDKEKLEEQRRRIQKDFDDTIQKKIPMLEATAKVEYIGKNWLLSHDISIENVIYYSHTHKFSFGWMKPFAPEVQVTLRELLKDFPYPWEFAKKEKK